MRTQVPNDDRWKTKKKIASSPIPSIVNLPIVSPVGKTNNGGDSASPLDDKTIAETPSPGDYGIFSPKALQVKVLPTTDNKKKKKHIPFDETPGKNTEITVDRGKYEGKRDFESIWKAANKEQKQAVDSISNNDKYNKDDNGSINHEKKFSPHTRQLTQIMHNIISPDHTPTTTSGYKKNVAAPLPFVSPRTPAPTSLSPTNSTDELLLVDSPYTRVYIPTETFSVESSPTDIERSLSAIAENNKFSLSLSEQIALAQKLGAAERLAFTTESQQCPTQQLNTSANKSSHEVMTRPSMRSSTLSDNTKDKAVVVTSTNRNTNVSAMKPHFLFQSMVKNNHGDSCANNNIDKIDRILSQEIAAAASDAAIESELYRSTLAQDSSRTKVTPEDEPGALTPTLWKVEDLISQQQEKDKEVPFDFADDDSDIYNNTNKYCIDEGKTLQYLEEGTCVEKPKKVTVQKIIRDLNGTIAGITVKKGHRGGSTVTPEILMETMKSFRDNSSIDPPELVDFVDNKSLRESFLDEPLASLTLAAGGDKSFDTLLVESPRYTMDNGSPERKKQELTSVDKIGGRSWTWIVIHICTLIVLIVCGIFAGLFASGVLSFWSKGASNDSSEGSNTWDDTPVASVISNATVTPTENKIESNIFEGSEIVACGNAVPITEMDQPYYGSNWKAFWDETIDTCGDQMSTGYAVWYSFTTNSSKLVEASTCNNADFDTQITVMSDSCNEPTCVSYNDQACGDQSMVTWYVEAFTTYYIMVHGYREASGTFGLTMTDASRNDQCVDAVRLDPESVIAGTTAGAKSLEELHQCGDVDLSGNGVWYEVGNVTGFYRAEILHGYTDFSGQVSVYRSMDEIDLGCKALICEKGSSTGSVMWLAEAKDTYYVYINGKNGIAGDFDLFLGQNKASSCDFGTRLDPNSVSYLSSTKASNPQNVESCGYTGYHTAPGVWFSTEGTGDILEVSTCGSLLDLDTQISVFANDCDSLECIGGTGQDYPCGDNGSVSWKSEIKKIYHIYVSGRSSRVGDFVLTINDVPILDGYACDGSLPLDQGSTSMKSNTTKAPSGLVDLCKGTSAVRGVWHSFVGTGNAMKISVCNEETDFDAQISMFTGSCDGLSCIAHTGSRCGENNEILITTHVGVTYYIFVHGPDSFSIGNYLLTIDETEINDSCGTASILDLSSSAQYFGSTLSASNSTAIECSGSEELISESAALWYTFSGTGEIITFSTCSYLTDFSTDVRIFNGGCSEFGCVSNVENIYAITNCRQQSAISFQSISDEVYYARIGGNSTNDTGNFIMEVNPNSKFFGP